MRLLLASIGCAAAWIICDPLEHGAAGTGLVYDTLPLRAAAAQCGTAGGGVLWLREGHTFLSGALNLSSNTELRVDGTLLGSPNATDYVLVDFLPWYGPDPPQKLAGGGAPVPCITSNDCREWGPFIQTWYESNVSITGKGVIDGNGAAWWLCASNQSAFPCSGYTRPHGIRLVGGSTFSISGVSIRNMPMWQVHLAYVTGAHVHDVSITAPSQDGHNTDGIDPDCAQDVLIERVHISTGDDNIAIKSGRNWYGRTFGRPSKNITVRDSVFGTGHGMSIGSEMSGGVYNVLFDNITSVGGGCGPRIKSERGRGGLVANITYRNIVMRDCAEALQITDNYDPGIPPTNATATPVFRNISMLNISANCASTFSFDGLPESQIHELTLRNVSLGKAPSKKCDYVDTATAVCENVLPACPPCFGGGGGAGW
jgi:polygalacturonase